MIVFTEIGTYSVELFAHMNGVKKVFNRYIIEDTDLDHFKISLLKRLGNVHHFEKEKARAKEIVYTAKSVEEMVELVNIETSFGLTVRRLR
ncbi:hypothetical protein ACT7TG_003018 [Listeria monocytogenes]|uniref:Uncharacterized protein n=1 Tax=Listeria monocytogenes TaxID=1639 RepID=A0AB37NK54_LISMN|nr:hypothetical protein [Listeria monocytogenes]RKA09294.1 hypothetical protein DYZ80_00936 [Listeria monocytogenes]